MSLTRFHLVFANPRVGAGGIAQSKHSMQRARPQDPRQAMPKPPWHLLKHLTLPDVALARRVPLPSVVQRLPPRRCRYARTGKTPGGWDPGRATRWPCRPGPFARSSVVIFASHPAAVIRKIPSGSPYSQLTGTATARSGRCRNVSVDERRAYRAAGDVSMTPHAAVARA